MPEDFTIREFMMANRREVIEMSLFEFDEEYYMDLFKEEYRQEGFQEGFQKGFQKGYQEGFQKGYQEGIEIGRQIVITWFISNSFAMLKDAKLSEETAIAAIAQQYQLSADEIRRIVSDYPGNH